MTTVLRRARLGRGLTLRELAAEVGCSHSAIFHMEKGHVARPNPGLALRIEHYFGVPVEVLMQPLPENANSGPKPAAHVATTPVATPSPGAAEGGAVDGS